MFCILTPERARESVVSPVVQNILGREQVVL